MQPAYQSPVADYVRYHAEHRPHEGAIVDAGETVSYAALNRRSSQVANALISLGCRPGDRIGYLGVTSGPFVEVFLGAIKANMAYTGLNWRLTEPELEYILRDSGARVVFCDKALEPMMQRLWQKVDSLEAVLPADPESFTVWRSRHEVRDPLLAHSGEDTIFHLYTSGTTGFPKGVCLSNFCMSEQRKAEDQFGDWFPRSDPQEVIINATPNFHVGGLGWLLISLFRGAKVLLMPAPDPDRFLDLIEKQAVTHLFAVPVTLGMMLEAQKIQPRDLSSLKVIHYGAAAMAPALLRESIEILGCEFVQYYGMTESNGIVTVLAPCEHRLDRPERLTSVGRAIPGTELQIRDPGGQILPPGENGEIWIKSTTIMKGYWKLPEATAEVLVDGWYRTGDGGRLDEEGFLYMGDRIRDMIVSGGENIYPSEVENALIEHPGVADVAVIGVPHEKWGEAAKGFVVLAEGMEASPEDLISFLRDRLAGYKIPRIYKFIRELPRTASGKVKKFELRDGS
jgi:acyl-CoA synthetase (AMP-forming)/AMP-acid ligase II